MGNLVLCSADVIIDKCHEQIKNYEKWVNVTGNVGWTVFHEESGKEVSPGELYNYILHTCLAKKSLGVDLFKFDGGDLWHLFNLKFSMLNKK